MVMYIVTVELIMTCSVIYEIVLSLFPKQHYIVTMVFFEWSLQHRNDRRINKLKDHDIMNHGVETD